MTVPATGPVWIGTSWKMNFTIAEAVAYIDRLTQILTDQPTDGVQPFVLPPHTALAAVRDRLPADSPVLLGAQNAHWAAEGAGTGEISMRMAADAGARIVELGHSERRADFGETDQTVARKVAAALTAGLTPLVCVGESADVRDAGRAETFVAGQVRAALAEVPAGRVSEVVIAYEPVWAIGAQGRVATPAEIGPVLALVSKTAAERGGPARAVLYGGSVDAEHAADLLADPHTDGLFVGRSAWTPEGLARLIAIGAEHAAPGTDVRRSA